MHLESHNEIAHISYKIFYWGTYMLEIWCTYKTIEFLFFENGGFLRKYIDFNPNTRKSYAERFWAGDSNLYSSVSFLIIAGRQIPLEWEYPGEWKLLFQFLNFKNFLNRNIDKRWIVFRSTAMIWKDLVAERIGFQTDWLFFFYIK